MSEYIELMQSRKLALFAGDEKTAFKLMEKAEKLIKAGVVTDKELLAAGYL